MSQVFWIIRATLIVLRRRNQFDVLHLQGMYLTNLIPALFAGRRSRVLGLPVLERGDLRVSAKLLSGGIKRSLLTAVLKRVDHVFALSSGLQNELHSLGVLDSRISRIGNPVNPRYYNVPQGPTPDRVRLGFVGKLGPTKQPHLVLESIALLNSANDRYYAAFAGPFVDGAYRDYFMSEISRLDLSERVQVLGNVQDVEKFLHHEVDIFVLPSKAEGMPGAMAEAMFAGLPCIVTDVGAMGDTVRTSAAGQVVDGNAASIANATQVSSDPQTWKSLSLKAREYADTHFADSSVTAIYEEVLQTLSARKKFPMNRSTK